MQHRSAPPDPSTSEPELDAAPPPADAVQREGAAEPHVEPDATASCRTFLRGSLLGAGAFGAAGALGAVAAPELAQAQAGALKSTVSHYHLPAKLG